MSQWVIVEEGKENLWEYLWVRVLNDYDTITLFYGFQILRLV